MERELAIGNGTNFLKTNHDQVSCQVSEYLSGWGLESPSDPHAQIHFISSWSAAWSHRCLYRLLSRLSDITEGGISLSMTQKPGTCLTSCTYRAAGSWSVPASLSQNPGVGALGF